MSDCRVSLNNNNDTEQLFQRDLCVASDIVLYMCVASDTISCVLLYSSPIHTCRPISLFTLLSYML